VPKNMQSEARKSHMMSFLWSIPVEVGAWWAASCDMVLAGRREKVDQ
jgi:hypothetical protein